MKLLSQAVTSDPGLRIASNDKAAERATDVQRPQEDSEPLTKRRKLVEEPSTLETLTRQLCCILKINPSTDLASVESVILWVTMLIIWVLY